MGLPTPPAVKLDSLYVKSYGANTACPERALWLAVLAQAADDLFHGDPRIRKDALRFFKGQDLLRVLTLAGISHAEVPWLRAKAEELTEVPPELRQRNARPIIYEGQIYSLTQWAVLTGVNVTTLSHRLKNNWSLERALTTPSRRRTATAA